MNPNIDNEIMDGIIWADIVVWQYAQPMYLVMKMQNVCRSHGYKKLFVADFDDDYLHIDPTNVNYREWGTENVDPFWVDGQKDFDIDTNKKRVDLMCQAISCCDMITVTTEELRKNYLHLNPNIVVLKNCINPSVMPIRKIDKNPDRVVIAWQGSDSHAGEMAQHMKVLEQIKEAYGDKVHFKFFGSALAKRFFDKVDGEFIPWVRPSLFYDVFSRHQIDIGLVIVNDTIFNRSKSSIKWLEYSYYNIPTIAKAIPPYSTTMTHSVNSVLFRDEDGLYNGLCELIDNPLLRAKLSGAARRHVLHHYKISDNAELWKKIYMNAYLQTFSTPHHSKDS